MRQRAGISGTTLAVLLRGVEKSTLHSTKGRPKLQPLALQKPPVTADAGDSNGPSSASPGSAGGPLFSDLMTAAIPTQGSGVADQASLKDDTLPQTAGASASQDGDNADEDLAALAAASQLATRGVALRATTATEIATANSSLKLKVISADAPLVDEAISGELMVAETKVTAEASDDKLPAHKDSSVTDGGELDVQALINMAMTAALAPAPDHHTAATETASHSEQNLSTLQAGDHQDAVLASMESDARAIVGLSTASGTPDENLSSAVAGLTEGTSAQKPPAKIAALQAVGWFDGAPRQDVSTTTQRATSEAPTLDSPTEAVISTESVDGASQQDHDPKNARRNVSDERLTIDLQTEAPLSVQTADDEQGANSSVEGDVTADQGRKANGADAEEIATQALPQPLALVPQDIAISPNQNLAQQAAQALNGVGSRSQTDTPAQQKSVTQSDDAQTFSLPAAVSATDDAAQAPTSKDHGGANASASPKETLNSIDHAGGTTGPALATTEISPADAAAFRTDQSADKAEWTPNKTGPQDPDARQLEVSERKAHDDKDNAEKREPNIKGDVNIRELMKLGATDVSLSFAQPDLPAAEQQALEHPLLPQARASQQPTAQQTAPMATSNIETNGERRTIADGIRLRALERMVVNAARNGTQILSIQLYPPGLGQVVLRLAMDGQRLRLATRAATTEAADTLRNMEADLRDALAGNGLQLAGFDVSEDGPNDEAPRRQPVEPVVKTRIGGTKESFIVDLNA